MDFNFKHTSQLTDSYDNVDDYIISDIKSSEEYLALDLRLQEDCNEARRMLEPGGDFWLATCDGLAENYNL